MFEVPQHLHMSSHIAQPVDCCLVCRRPAIDVRMHEATPHLPGFKHVGCVQADSRRVITFANRADYISFRHHTYEQPAEPKSTVLTECGPRFELKLYQIRLGTLEQAHAETEWVVRAYTRSAKRQKLAETDLGS